MSNRQTMFASMLPNGGGSSACAPITNTTTTIIDANTGSNGDSSAAGINHYYQFAVKSYILRASELGATKQITGLQYFLADNDGISSLDWDEVKIIMAHCGSSTQLPTDITLNNNNQGYSDFEECVDNEGWFGCVDTPIINNSSGFILTDQTLCRSGSLFLTNTETWKTINFNQDNFCYNGTDNVFVSVLSNLGYIPPFGDPNPQWEHSFSYSSTSPNYRAGGFYDADYGPPPLTSSTSTAWIERETSGNRPHLKIKH